MNTKKVWVVVLVAMVAVVSVAVVFNADRIGYALGLHTSVSSDGNGFQPTIISVDVLDDGGVPITSPLSLGSVTYVSDGTHYSSSNPDPLTGKLKVLTANDAPSKMRMWVNMDPGIWLLVSDIVLHYNGGTYHCDFTTDGSRLQSNVPTEPIDVVTSTLDYSLSVTMKNNLDWNPGTVNLSTISFVFAEYTGDPLEG